MTAAPDLRLRAREGFTPGIGEMVALLEETRRTTLAAVQHLTTAQLHTSFSPVTNTIGALLAHIAAVEWAYSVATFEGREPTAQEKAEWGPALRLGLVAQNAYRGWTLDKHERLLAEVRQRTLDELARRDDPWLDDEFTLLDGSLVNHRWAWFHVFEDELSHRGQILLIRNHLLRTA